MFFITNILLFYFAGKYYHRKDRRALLPAQQQVGTGLDGGARRGDDRHHHLRAQRMEPSLLPPPAGTPKGGALRAAVQLDHPLPGTGWPLGRYGFRLISDNNPLGIVTENSIKARLEELATIVAAEEEAGGAEGILPR